MARITLISYLIEGEPPEAGLLVRTTLRARCSGRADVPLEADVKADLSIESVHHCKHHCNMHASNVL